MKRFFLYGCLFVVLASCGKSSDEPSNEIPKSQTSGISTAMSSFQAPMAFISTFVNVEDAMSQVKANQSSRQSSRRLSANGNMLNVDATDYPSIDWLPKDGTWPINVVVDYGTKNVVGSDGLMHRGKINISATGMFETDGTRLTADFDNFYVYNAILTGKQTITNRGKNDEGHLIFHVLVDSGKVASIGHFDYSENTTRELVDGYKEDGSLNSNIQSHKYSIIGSMSYLSSDDTIPNFEVIISDDNPMVIAVGDAYPVNGKLKIEATNNKKFNFSKSIIPSELSALFPALPDKIELDHLDVVFNGKNTDGTYKVEVEFDVPLVTHALELILSFNIDKDGKVSSIKINQDN